MKRCVSNPCPYLSLKILKSELQLLGKVEAIFFMYFNSDAGLTNVIRILHVYKDGPHITKESIKSYWVFSLHKMTRVEYKI